MPEPTATTPHPDMHCVGALPAPRPNADQPAYPCHGEKPIMFMSRPDGSIEALTQGGLTKRELIAAMAMQGMCANPDPQTAEGNPHIPRWAVNMADALLAELAKPREVQS